MSLEDMKFQHPFTSIIAGMTSSGKTYFVRKLLNNWKQLIAVDVNVLKIMWCYNETESLSKVNASNCEIVYIKGIPNLDEIKQFKPNLIVLDDLMDDVSNEIKELFTRGSHHMNISIIFIVQNIFNQNKQMRTICLNAHYIVLTKGLRNTQQISLLGKQIFSKSKELIEVFKHATSRPFGYLILDLHPQTKDEFRLRTRIFRDELTPNLAKYHTFAPIYYNIT